ncbi:hypothetical protein GOV03_01210 [Candidatus Woesearchaeota archaeon]|nr:hypothetical protein [Candidatus Woesearchaeota archaeon]
MKPELLKIAKRNITHLWNHRDPNNLEGVLKKMEQLPEGILADENLGEERFDMVSAHYQAILEYFPQHNKALEYVTAHAKK